MFILYISVASFVYLSTLNKLQINKIKFTDTSFFGLVLKLQIYAGQITYGQ